MSPANGAPALQLTLLGLLFVVIGQLSTVMVALAAGRVRHFLLRHPAILRWQGRVVGEIYCALGLRLAFQERCDL